MNLSISNIAWTAKDDTEMYQFLKVNGFNGLEIAPTRIFSENPYDKIFEAKDFAENLKEKFGLTISSMQSIWYGRSEKIFGSQNERNSLIEYTRKAVHFSQAIGCKNLVFGCPRNREIHNIINDYPIAIDFFHTLGEIAIENNTIIAIEANPTIYNTNFINYTEQAVEFVSKTKSLGIKVNFDLGTVIYNEEDLNYIQSIFEYVNHVHISEPELKPIKKREIMHLSLIGFIKTHLPSIYISIEMGKLENIDTVKGVIKYVKGISEEMIYIKKNDYPKWMKFVRFGIVGIISTIVTYIIYYLLMLVINISIAYTLAYIAAFIVNYLLTTKFTFNVKASPKNAVGFIISNIINYLLSLGLLNFFIWIGISKALAPIPMFAITIPTNFFLVSLVMKK